VRKMPPPALGGSFLPPHPSNHSLCFYRNVLFSMSICNCLQNGRPIVHFLHWQEYAAGRLGQSRTRLSIAPRANSKRVE
jgi:hypothetical protein